MLGVIASLALAATQSEAAPHRLFHIDRDCRPVGARDARTSKDRRFGPLLRACSLKVGKPGRTHVMVIRLFAPRPANSRDCKPPNYWIYLYTGTGENGSVGFNEMDTSDNGLAVDPGTGDIDVNTPNGSNTTVDINTSYAGDGSMWDQNPKNDVEISPSVGSASGCSMSVLGNDELTFCVPHANHDYEYILTLYYDGGRTKRIDPMIKNH